MNIADLKTRFFEVVPSHPPNDWEIEEHLENITRLPENQQNLVLSQVPVIWPVSHSLCYSYLTLAEQALTCLSPERLLQWVGNILDIYEKDGLRAAQDFMTDVEANFLCRIRGESGLSFNEAEKLLTPYTRSIAQRNISLAAGPQIYTDVESIFLPPKLTLCTYDQENFLLYKLIVTFQLGLLLLKTFRFKLAQDHDLVQTLADAHGKASAPGPVRLEQFFALFPGPGLAQDIFTLCEAQRISRFIRSAFPGLWRDTAKIRANLAEARQFKEELPLNSRILEELTRQVIKGTPDTNAASKDESFWKEVWRLFSQVSDTAAESAQKTATLFDLLHAGQDGYKKIEPIYYCGSLNPAAARKGMLRLRQGARERFVKALAAVMRTSEPLNPAEAEAENTDAGKSVIPAGEEGTAMHLAPSDREKKAPAPEKEEAFRLLTLEGPSDDLPESLRNLVNEIVADLGHIPNDYISAAQGIAGRGVPPSVSQDAGPDGSLTAPITYDEWDFRRNGFRKNWCQLLEKKVQPVRGTFIENTLDTYQGLLRQLKKQFEMLRTRERFIKRQRFGDDIDLDAMIESIADARAGQPFSERLFIRLQRDDRDIAVLFLVDMSSSTEGWINRALKESLILMGEALHVLGDRFAIYGFSGMRRTRSDFYHVKTFAEAYNQETKERIAGISPQEYTRMGPPLRHAIEILQDVEAKVRLLVVLSDGKPEDYDDYKGEYAIEDTRHALIEAKSVGIHPFCIAIDKKAHDYISHMYGEVNYIFVDQVRKLPVRLPEIYRVLTT